MLDARLRFAAPLGDERPERGPIFASLPNSHPSPVPSRVRWILDPEPRFPPGESGESENSLDSRRNLAPLVVRLLVPLFQDFVHQLVYFTVRPIGIDLVLKSFQHGRASLLGIVDIPAPRVHEGVRLAAFDQ